jgi:hypothetical protein
MDQEHCCEVLTITFAEKGKNVLELEDWKFMPWVLMENYFLLVSS